MRVGFDLVEIARIADSMKTPRFLARVFSSAEIDLFEARGMKPQTVAANFAAKEAFGKALGTGVREFSLCEVSALRDEMGAPYLVLTGDAKRIADARGLRFSLSLTHTDTTAGAVVIAYERGAGG